MPILNQLFAYQKPILGQYHLQICRCKANRQPNSANRMPILNQPGANPEKAIFLFHFTNLSIHANLCQSLPILANPCQSVPILANPVPIEGQSMPIRANPCQSRANSFISPNCQYVPIRRQCFSPTHSPIQCQFTLSFSTTFKGQFTPITVNSLSIFQSDTISPPLPILR